MTLSVIIVNYNVKYFLEQCLHSVTKAVERTEAEVIVVDNRSTDGSLAYLAPTFPSVTFVESEANLGFGTACNLGLRRSTGEYVLFLNPDTLVAEDSFAECIAFFQQRPQCGALGVKMIDGSGQFLKESKRAFPAPLTSLYKLSGLARLFPKSNTFSRYHLGHLTKEESHEVDVLAGAFLMTKREVLRHAGVFDEAFFMYGEDVDLSYRIQKGGHQNWYFAGTAVIHFKGESTKRGSLNYVRMFYQAMITFVNKHYGGARAGLFTFSIRLAIGARAAVSVAVNGLKWVGIPVVDAVIILGCLYGVKEFWTAVVREEIDYPDKLLLISFPIFTLIYLGAAYYAGLYDKHFRLRNLLRSTGAATVTLLAVYALLPEAYRFSRGIIVFGAAAAFVCIALLRWGLVKAGVLRPPAEDSAEPHILIAGNGREFNDVKKFLAEKGFANRIIGRVGINEADDAVTHMADLQTTGPALNAKELIFCARTLSYKTIIGLTERHAGSGLKFRYHAVGSGSIVGSDTSTDSGETLSAEAVFNLNKASHRRSKRLVDVVSSLFFLLTFPVHFFGVKNPVTFFARCFSVIAGNKTWVGYLRGHPTLPPLRKNVLAPAGPKELSAKLSEQSGALLDYGYARNHEPLRDLKTIFAWYRCLGS